MPWLAVGLAGAMASAGMLASIEDQMASNLAVAYFIPGIVYLADAVGTQTETLAIRGLSVGVGIGRIARREALTGLLVGCLLAAAHVPPHQLAMARSRTSSRGVDIGASRQHHRHPGRHGPALAAASPRPRPRIRVRADRLPSSK